MSDRTAWEAPSIAGALWAVAFGLLHVAWAAGSRFALSDHAAADAAFEQPWFRTYNLSVAVACLAVVVAVLLLVRNDRGVVHDLSRRVIWLAAGVLVLRGGIGAVQLLARALSRDDERALSAWAIDLYMLAGGAMLLLVAWRSRPTPRDLVEPRRAADDGR